MFTWICPQCGREVPPAYADCPDCAAKAAAAPPPQAPAEPVAPPQAAPPPAYVPPPPPPVTQPYYPAPPAQPYYPPQPPPSAYYPPPQPPQPRPPAVPSRFVLPVWLLTIVFALAFVGLVGGIYWIVQVARGTGQPSTPSASVESPAAKSGAKTNPLQRYIEVAGVRFVQDAKTKKTMAKFLLINHSEADFSGLAGNVTIWGRTQKSEEDAEGTFSFTSNVGPLESKELTAPVNSKLQIYEMPDWQNITVDVQITAPAPEAAAGSGGPQ